MPALSKKNLRRNFPKLLSTGGGGGGGRSDYEKFLLDSIFPTKLTEFPTKLTEFVPFIFIISQYCPTVNRGFHKLLLILIIVAQKRKKSCLKIAHFPQKVATLQESCSKVATLVALPSRAILTFEQF